MTGKPIFRWADVEPQVRRETINALHIDRPQIAAVRARMDLMRQGHREGREATCMTLTGEPGVGKSEFLKHYRDANPVIEERTAEGILRRRPVVYVELPSAATVLTTADWIMRELLGDRAPTGPRVRDGLMERQLVLQKVEILILDEFQHVGEKGAEKTRAQTADFVKGITKRTRIPIVMAGMGVIDDLIVDNKQLTSITPYMFAVRPYGFHSDEEKKGFRDYLKMVERELPFDEPAKLASRFATELFLASGGNLRILMRIISEAGRLAIEEDACSIFERHLHDAFEAEASEFENPFTFRGDEAA